MRDRDRQDIGERSWKLAVPLNWVNWNETGIPNPGGRGARPGAGRPALVAASGPGHRPGWPPGWKSLGSGGGPGAGRAGRGDAGLALPAGAAAWGMIRLAALAGPLAADLPPIVVIYTTIAARDLARHSMAVCRPLAEGDLIEARRRVAAIVGRDTAVARRGGHRAGGRGKRGRKHRRRRDRPAVLGHRRRARRRDGLSRRQHAGFDVRPSG